ncbi:VOC family protein [Alteromonas pelagimontana]|uniref:VOC family protein n=1 Tax=Alteromonas pelagimontana TaxID=1858656 RepID=A0A6M4MFM7_9ALTE|nr:VOC family protein [Alteromonas pelagimontana]QJR81688.1 VOC family protein [Alteromonas pelagimontana]
MSLLDHIEIPVADGPSVKAFYEHTLKGLGMSVVVDIPPEHNKHGGMRCGFGVDDYPCFWIHDNAETKASLHIAFTAKSHEQVNELFRLALESGGKDNGLPGIRQHYHNNYYAAYVLDPEGNNIEFVCQKNS